MKISLDNKLEFLYQWDIDRKIIITGAALEQEVHFATKDLDEALVVKPKEENGSLTCNIPNILLQDTKDIVIYLYDGHKTFFSKTYKIIARKKPADYVYNETEILTYEKLAKELKEMIVTRANGIGYSNSKLSLYSDGKEIASTNIVTDDYRPLQYKPSINNIVLEGNKTANDYNIGNGLKVDEAKVTYKGEEISFKDFITQYIKDDVPHEIYVGSEEPQGNEVIWVDDSTTAENIVATKDYVDEVVSSALADVDITIAEIDSLIGEVNSNE